MWANVMVFQLNSDLNYFWFGDLFSTFLNQVRWCDLISFVVLTLKMSALSEITCPLLLPFCFSFFSFSPFFSFMHPQITSALSAGAFSGVWVMRAYGNSCSRSRLYMFLAGKISKCICRQGSLWLWYCCASTVQKKGMWK